jgi:hypothetical protein
LSGRLRGTATVKQQYEKHGGPLAHYKKKLLFLHHVNTTWCLRKFNYNERIQTKREIEREKEEIK